MSEIIINGTGTVHTGTMKSLEKLLQAFFATIKTKDYHVLTTINRANRYNSKTKAYDNSNEYTVTVNSTDDIDTETKALLNALDGSGEQTAKGKKESSL